MVKLTPKQKQFCEEYLIDLNQTQAAIRAGYSQKTAGSIGNENLTKPEIQQYIQELQNKRAERVEITQDMVLKEYARIAFLDPRKLFDENGKIKQITDLDEDTARALAGLDHAILTQRAGEDVTIEELTKKFKFVDKKGALDSVARHLGMFNDKMTIDDTREGKKIKLPDGTEIDI